MILKKNGRIYRLILPLLGMFFLMHACEAAAYLSIGDMPEYAFHDVFDTHEPTRIAVDHENRKWFMAANALFMYDDAEWTRYYAGQDVPVNLRDIHVDPAGHVWLAAFNDIAEWDGVSWTIHDPTENPGMPVMSISHIRIGPTGDWWVAAGDSLFRYDGAVWNSAAIPVEGEATGLEVDKANTAWLLVGNDVVAYDGTMWRKKSINLEPSEWLISMLLRPGGNILIVTKSGLWEHDGVNWIMISQFPHMTFRDAYCIDDDNRVWLDRYGMIVCAKGESYAEIDYRQAMDVAVDRSGHFWGVSRYGAFSFLMKFIDVNLSDAGKWYDYDYPTPCYPGDRIPITWLADRVEELTISVSSAGREWIPIAEHVPPEQCRFEWTIPWDVLPKSQVASQLRIRITAADCVSDIEEFTVLRPGYYSEIELYQIGIKTINWAPSIQEDADGNLWFLNSKGLVKFDGETFTIYERENRTFTRFACTPDGNIWVFYHDKDYNDSIAVFDGIVFTELFEGEDVNLLAATPDGDVWISKVVRNPPDVWPSFIQHLYRYHEGEWILESEQFEQSQLPIIINSFVSTSDGTLWMSLFGSGIWMFENDKWTDIGSYPFEEIYPDNTGGIWGANPETLFEWRDNEWIAHPIQVVLGDESSSLYIRNVIWDNDGMLWCNTYGGMLLFDGEDDWLLYDSEPFRSAELLYIDRNNTKWFSMFGNLAKLDDLPLAAHSATAPAPFALDTPYPNPFNLSVTIPFSLPEAARVEVSIYSITGQRVRELSADRLPAGFHALRWDGRDDAGAVVSSGLYIVRAVAGGHIAARKVVLVK